MNNRVEIKVELCKGCRLCVDACPKGCIAFGSEINAGGNQYAVFDGGNCSACGLCFYVCPEPGAITVLKGS